MGSSPYLTSVGEPHSTKLKMAEFAPIPKASVRITIEVVPGLRQSVVTARRISRTD